MQDALAGIQQRGVGGIIFTGLTKSSDTICNQGAQPKFMCQSANVHSPVGNWKMRTTCQRLAQFLKQAQDSLILFMQKRHLITTQIWVSEPVIWSFWVVSTHLLWVWDYGPWQIPAKVGLTASEPSPASPRLVSSFPWHQHQLYREQLLMLIGLRASAELVFITMFILWDTEYILMRASGSKSSGFGLACFFVCCDKAGGKSVSLDFVEWGKRRQLRLGAEQGLVLSSVCNSNVSLPEMLIGIYIHKPTLAVELCA